MSKSENTIDYSTVLLHTSVYQGWVTRPIQQPAEVRPGEEVEQEEPHLGSS